MSFVQLLILNLIGLVVLFISYAMIYKIDHKKGVKYHRRSCNQKKYSNVDDLVPQLEDIKKKIARIQREVDYEISVLNALKVEADNAKTILGMSEGQLMATRNLLEKEAIKRDRVNLYTNFLISFLFFVLGTIASFLITKIT